MSTCQDPDVGRLLHAYELNALSEEDKERFEIHLLECEYCYDELKAFEEEAALLRSAEEVKNLAKEVVGQESPRDSFLRRLWKSLWPDTSLVLKPAVAYLLVLLLLIPAYRVFRAVKQEEVRRVRIVNLFPDRSAAENVFKKSAGDDGMISFVFKGAVPGESYRVLIQSQDDRVVFRDDAFDGFDEYGTGWLLLPIAKMKPGHYRLVITDPGAESGQDTTYYYFTVGP